MGAGEPSTIEQEYLPLREGEHIIGNPDADTTIVEFGDYECPGCGEAYMIFKQLLEKCNHEFRFAFRHYPYARLHPHAELAAQAAEAAGAQGKFWEMHDLLFEDQKHLDLRSLEGRADKLGLDASKFRQDLESEVYLDRVREDFRTGVQNGVFGTPTLFINGIRHNGSLDYGTLAGIIDKNRK